MPTMATLIHHVRRRHRSRRDDLKSAKRQARAEKCQDYFGKVSPRVAPTTCSRKSGNRKCHIVADRLDTKGNPVCHIHDPYGTQAMKNKKEAARKKYRR